MHRQAEGLSASLHSEGESSMGLAHGSETTFNDFQLRPRGFRKRRPCRRSSSSSDLAMCVLRAPRDRSVAFGPPFILTALPSLIYPLSSDTGI